MSHQPEKTGVSLSLKLYLRLPLYITQFFFQKTLKSGMYRLHFLIHEITFEKTWEWSLCKNCALNKPAPYSGKIILTLRIRVILVHLYSYMVHWYIDTPHWSPRHVIGGTVVH